MSESENQLLSLKGLVVFIVIFKRLLVIFKRLLVTSVERLVHVIIQWNKFPSVDYICVIGY